MPQTDRLMASELVKILVDRLAYDGDFEVRAWDQGAEPAERQITSVRDAEDTCLFLHLNEALPISPTDRAPGESVRWTMITPASNLELEIEEATTRYFEDRAVGSVGEAEWKAKADEIRNAYYYLAQEQCYRVEYNRAFGPVPRINWAEDINVESASLNGQDAARSFNRCRTIGQIPVRLVSVRQATVADLDEFLEAK